MTLGAKSANSLSLKGCKWYHFYPDEKFQAHLDKFKES